MSLADAAVTAAMQYDGAIDDADPLTLGDAPDGTGPMRLQWEAFRTFFQVVDGWTWNAGRLRQAKTPWQHITESGHAGSPAVHWCGIFATWAWHEAGCPVRWRSDGLHWGKGKLRALKVKGNEAKIDMGDICFKEEQHTVEKNGVKQVRWFTHFVLVLGRDEANHGVRVIEGNSTAGQAIRSTHTYPFSRLAGYYPLPESLDTPTALAGRWVVWIGVWTWNYIFLRNGTVYWTDIRDTNLVQGKGHWQVTSDRVVIHWPDSGVTDYWWLPVSAGGQQGLCVGQAPVRARKLESELEVNPGRLRFA